MQIWNSSLSDESVEDMTNSNLHVMRFLGLPLGNDGRIILCYRDFRTWLAAKQERDRLLRRSNGKFRLTTLRLRTIATLMQALREVRANLKSNQLTK